MVVGSVDRWGKVSIPTKTVAQAMMKNTFQSTEKKVDFIEQNQIFKLAEI